MKNVKLSNGIEMPILGFGVFQIPDEKECTQAVTDALEVGYRHIDTAAIYRNEKAVGDAIKHSGIARDELFITTKLWIQDADEHRAIKAFHKSLDKLGLDYLDLYLIHQPFGDVYGAWRALETLYKEGRVKAIGVSNFYPDRLADLIVHNDIAPMVNQIETHPYFQRAEYQEILKNRGVQLESWAPFAQGRNDLFTNPVLAKIATAHGKTIGQVVLRWLIQRDVVVIPKSVHRDRIEENFDVFGFELNGSDMAEIAKLDTGASIFIDHRTHEAAEGLGAHTAEL
jgi:diketogulonate reductase-like aldo/keto reductase